MDHTKSWCEKLYEDGTDIAERGWGPDLKALDRTGHQLVGDRWLRFDGDELIEGDITVRGRHRPPPSRGAFTRQNMDQELIQRI